MKYTPNSVPFSADISDFVGRELARIADAMRNLEVDTLTTRVSGSLLTPLVTIADVGVTNGFIPPLFAGASQLFAIETASNVLQTLTSYRSDTQGPALGFRHSRSPTLGGHTAVAVNDVLGQVLYYGSDGAGFQSSAGILAYVDAAVSAGVVPARVGFLVTTPAGVLTEAARIGSDCRLFGFPTGGGQWRLGPTVAGANDQHVGVSANAAIDYAYIGFWHSNFGTRRGYVGISGAARLEINSDVVSGETIFLNTDSGSFQRAALRIGGAVANSAIAFHNTAPIVKPTVAGLKAGNAALGSLLTALANYGLIIDTTGP